MITVIDMTSGELICSSNSAEAARPAAAPENVRHSLPALALQVVQPETVADVPLPGVVEIPVEHLLARFA